jgi:hypothetical protein
MSTMKIKCLLTWASEIPYPIGEPQRVEAHVNDA